VNDRLWWYVARSAGLVSWSLLGIAVLWGLALSGRLTRRPKPAWVLDVHRFLGGLAVIFVGIHLAGLVADSFVPFGFADLFVPFASSWQPGAVAWGVTAFYLLVAIEITSLFMRRLPRRHWRAVHLTSYALFAVATIHLLTAGTNASNPVVQWSVLGMVAAVGNFTVVRAFSRAAPRAGSRAPVAVARSDAAAPPSADGSERARLRGGTAA